MIQKTVIGFSYKETIELEKEISIDIYVDMGIVSLYEKHKTREKCFIEFVDFINKKYETNIPYTAKLFASDGDQNFDFYIGFMF